MFKKFFNWIKSIHEKIYNAKVEEFRRRRNIYDIPEDFHTNPKYKAFKEIYDLEHPKLGVIDRVVLVATKSIKNFIGILAVIIIAIMAIGGFIIHGLSKVIGK